MNIEQLYAEYLKRRDVTTDSRKVREGSIFFALKGDNFDGNRFGSSYQDTWDMPAQKILYDVPTKLNSNLFTASSSDLAFNGWNTARDGSGDSYANEATVLNLAEAGESVTLYAQWRERTDRIQAYIKGTEQETYAEYHVDYGMPLRLEIETPEEYDSPLTCTWSIIPCDIENNEYYYDQEETVTGNERYLDLPSVTTDFIISCKVMEPPSNPTIYMMVQNVTQKHIYTNLVGMPRCSQSTPIALQDYAIQGFPYGERNRYRALARTQGQTEASCPFYGAA